MSYMRDRDRATRGVGAIASRDGSPKRERQRLRVAEGTRARDRAMAAVTRGALGALSFINPDATYTAVAPGYTATTTPAPPLLSDGIVAHPQPVDIVYMPHPTASPAPSPVSAPGPSPVTSSAGTTGVTMGPPIVASPIPPLPTLDTGTSIATVPATDSIMRNVLIAGGAALAAYLLFFHKGRA